MLWGITPNGIHEAIKEQDKIEDWVYFEPSKIHLSSLDHQFDIQRVHAVCVQNNIDFKPGRTLGSRIYNDKIPDGIITAGDNRIAVEVERSIKSKRRYDAIIYNYLKAIKAGKYTKILYIAPTQEKCDQIKRVFYTIGKITMKINGVNKPLQLLKGHLMFFEFVWLNDLQNYLSLIEK